MSIWTLVQKYIDETGATEASILRRARLDKGTFSAWRSRGVPALPAHEYIVGLSDALREPYGDVLEAILHDTGYLPEESAAIRTSMVRAGLRNVGPNYQEAARRIANRYLAAAGGDAALAVEKLIESGVEGMVDIEETQALYVLLMMSRLPDEPTDYQTYLKTLLENQNGKPLTRSEVELAARGKATSPPTNQSTKGG